MKALKHFFSSAAQLFKQIGALPHAIANASKKRAQQTALNEQEAERLDRIRNPSKYRGK
jgi:hypothetical protein